MAIIRRGREGSQLFQSIGSNLGTSILRGARLWVRRVEEPEWKWEETLRRHASVDGVPPLRARLGTSWVGIRFSPSLAEAL
jgi:hypothetical protein